MEGTRAALMDTSLNLSSSFAGKIAIIPCRRSFVHRTQKDLHDVTSILLVGLV